MHCLIYADDYFNVYFLFVIQSRILFFFVCDSLTYECYLNTDKFGMLKSQFRDAKQTTQNNKRKIKNTFVRKRIISKAFVMDTANCELH